MNRREWLTKTFGTVGAAAVVVAVPTAVTAAVAAPSMPEVPPLRMLDLGDKEPYWKTVTGLSTDELRTKMTMEELDELVASVKQSVVDARIAAGRCDDWSPFLGPEPQGIAWDRLVPYSYRPLTPEEWKELTTNYPYVEASYREIEERIMRDRYLNKPSYRYSSERPLLSNVSRAEYGENFKPTEQVIVDFYGDHPYYLPSPSTPPTASQLAGRRQWHTRRLQIELTEAEDLELDVLAKTQPYKVYRKRLSEIFDAHERRQKELRAMQITDEEIAAIMAHRKAARETEAKENAFYAAMEPGMPSAKVDFNKDQIHRLIDEWDGERNEELGERIREMIHKG